VEWKKCINSKEGAEFLLDQIITYECDANDKKGRLLSIQVDEYEGGIHMEWYVKVLKNYVGFTGRAQRKEYWMFVLFNLIISIILAILESLLGITNVLTGLYSLAVLLPSLAVAFRRLHDTGRSAWWILIGLIPLIGAIILIVFYCQDSDPNENQHGPNPK
jgi:uncharacterized membrane protein YhaH (DUF805 family)